MISSPCFENKSMCSVWGTDQHDVKVTTRKQLVSMRSSLLLSINPAVVSGQNKKSSIVTTEEKKSCSPPRCEDQDTAILIHSLAAEVVLSGLNGVSQHEKSQKKIETSGHGEYLSRILSLHHKAYINLSNNPDQAELGSKQRGSRLLSFKGRRPSASRFAPQEDIPGKATAFRTIKVCHIFKRIVICMLFCSRRSN